MWKSAGRAPSFVNYTLEFALQLSEKQGKTLVRVLLDIRPDRSWIHGPESTCTRGVLQCLQFCPYSYIVHDCIRSFFLLQNILFL